MHPHTHQMHQAAHMANTTSVHSAHQMSMMNANLMMMRSPRRRFEVDPVSETEGVAG
jgi:hypothetical protein